MMVFIHHDLIVYTFYRSCLENSLARHTAISASSSGWVPTITIMGSFPQAPWCYITSGTAPRFCTATLTPHDMVLPSFSDTSDGSWFRS
ncbi:MAG: hypothetical protein ABFC34_10925 [Methanobacterium sp.]